MLRSVDPRRKRKEADKYPAIVLVMFYFRRISDVPKWTGMFNVGRNKRMNNYLSWMMIVVVTIFFSNCILISTMPNSQMDCFIFIAIQDNCSWRKKA